MCKIFIQFIDPFHYAEKGGDYVKFMFLPRPDKTLFFIGFSKIPVHRRGRVYMKRFGHVYGTLRTLEEISRREFFTVREKGLFF